MQSKSAEIQGKIDHLDQLIQQGAADAQLNLWEMQRDDLKKELAAALAEEANQQAHQGRVNDATTEITTYFDTLYVGGQTMRELCSDEEAYQILRLSVSQAFIDQATKNSEVLSQVQTDSQAAIKQAIERANDFDNQNSTLVQENHRLNLELTDITSRFEAVNLLLSEAPSSEETEILKQKVIDLEAQLALKTKADEPKGDAKSQIDAMVQERENKKVKITNLRLADPSGINTKDYLATDVLTGEEISIHSNYIRSYKEVTAEEAEQIKAQADAINNSIPYVSTPDINPVNAVTETDEATTELPFQIPTSDGGTDQTTDRDTTQDTLVEQSTEESEVIREADHYRKPVTRFEYEALVARVDNIERHTNIQAVA